MTTMSDAEIIAWAKHVADVYTNEPDLTLSTRYRRLADLAEKGAEDWQPIATAPEDGTEVLMCRGNWFSVGRIEGGVCYWGYLALPTHWRPLPVPPGGGR